MVTTSFKAVRDYYLSYVTIPLYKLKVGTNFKNGVLDNILKIKKPHSLGLNTSEIKWERVSLECV